MRAKHEWRTCGCGAQIGLRESCQRCASAARARLHEAGIATMRGQEHCRHPEEQWHRNTDTCGLCGIALQKVRAAVKEQRWKELHIPKGAAKFPGPPPTMGDLIGVDCFAQGWGERLKAHQQREEAAVAALFRYLSLFAGHGRFHRVKNTPLRSESWPKAYGDARLETPPLCELPHWLDMDSDKLDAARAALERPEQSPRFNQAEFDRLTGRPRATRKKNARIRYGSG